MIRALRRRLRCDERGYTLVEMVVVMLILGIVMGGITTVFVSGGTAELDMNRRFQAQQQARLALDRVRGDIHCATGGLVATTGFSASILSALRLNVTSCNSTSPYVYWCVIQVTATPLRYQVWRTTAAAGPTATTCTSTDSSAVLVADYLTTTTEFTTPSYPLNGLQTVSVDFKSSANAASTSKDVYELSDSIVARNSTRCSATSPTWNSGTSTCAAPATIP